MILKKDFKFIDLFAGIGGFHLAMNKYSETAKCVFASEINDKAIRVYKTNFNVNSDYDITKVDGTKIEEFDVLCAGFPCQSFSKAGYQQGFNDSRGILFNEIERILQEKIKQDQKPKILILENVKNLISHDNNNTWYVIKKKLTDLNFNVIDKPIILGPDDFDIPQLRDRAVIVAVDCKIYDGPIDFEIFKSNLTATIYDYLDDLNVEEKREYLLPPREKNVLVAWDYFIKNLNRKVIGFPIWSDDFFEDRDTTDFPEWKIDFINKNKQLYKENKKMIDEWKVKFRIDEFIATHRKFEWQAGSSVNSVFEGIIQFRPSGIRVKKPTSIPTLVAMKHVPVIGREERYITPVEALKLQSFPIGFKYQEVGKDIYRLLGNAVNVDVIYNVFKSFIEYLERRVTNSAE